MATAGGPNIKRDGLVFAIDSYSNVRGFTKYGTSGTNNNHRAIRNLVNRTTSYSTANTSQISGGITYYTLYALTYPENSQSPANRDGITPGFENTSATKTYSCSRDLNYFVFDEDTNTWVADSYFNGERINGHCYDTYDGQPNQHATFQADFDNIKNVFPNATHIVIGSHAAENNVSNSATKSRLELIGLPSDHTSGTRWEYVLAGKIGKPWTHHYVRENVSSAVANMVIGLPLEGIGGDLTFDGTDDYLNLGDSSVWDFGQNGTVETLIKPTNSTGNDRIWCIDNNSSNLDAYLNSSGYNVYMHGGGVGTTTSLTQNQYNHLVAVYNSGTIQIYVNGVAGTMTGTTTGYNISNNSTNNSNLYLGCYRNLSYNLYGDMPIFKVYNRALSQQEVQQNFRAYKNRFDI